MKFSKYEVLRLFLRNTPAAQTGITLSFPQIEQILSAPLPDSAINHREWWSNQIDVSSRPQARAWMTAGFEVETVHQVRPDGWVSFRRK